MHSGHRTAAKLPGAWRCALVAGALALHGLLAIAGSLAPDRRGLGTHQQLGFPPCTIQQALGIRCPACGMTTAWSHFARGHWWSALQCSVAGTALAAAALVAIPWSVAMAGRGDWVGMSPGNGTTLAFFSSVLAIALIDWAARLALECFLGS